ATLTPAFLAMSRQLETWVTACWRTQSLSNPSPTHKFPADREKNREFRRIRLPSAILKTDTRANSESCSEIPYSTEQGIFADGTGNLYARTVNLNPRCRATCEVVVGLFRFTSAMYGVAVGLSTRWPAHHRTLSSR